jgi:hypothetical protein
VVREDALHDAHHRTESAFCRCAAILLVLHLIAGASRACTAAEPGKPAARAEADSVEVARDEQVPSLEQSDRKFLPFAGRPIARIRVRNLDVFGASIDDTTRAAKSRPGKILNSLNFRTREATIRRNLLFTEGDPVDPIRMADSERILRNLVFIRDARIVAGQDPGGGDSVNVLVIVRESWTLKLAGSLKEGNGFRASLTEQNLFGLGQQISGTLTAIPGISPRVDARYSVQNIRGSFVTGQAGYSKMPGEKAIAFGLSRELVSSVLGYAGGLDLRWAAIAAADTLPSTGDNSSDLIDLWVGKSFQLGIKQPGIDRRRVLFVSGRIRRLEFYKRPPVTPVTFSQYHNVNYFLGSLALIQSRHYRTRLLYNFGRIEDIPYGFLVRVTYGLADEEFARSGYASTTLAAGDRIERLGYGVGEIRIGGYPRRGNIEEGVVRLRALYFSNLLHAGGFPLRQFVGAAYTTGVHRLADDTINFNGDEGIRGVIYDSAVTGSERIQLNFETVAFTPWKVRGVTVAFFTFADLDFIGSGRRGISAHACYSGLGLGVRLHHEAYGIGPVQLRFAWYPRLPVDHDTYAYTVFGEERFPSIEFLGGKPEIVEY